MSDLFTKGTCLCVRLWDQSMESRAVGSAQDPDDWDLVDSPDQDAMTPPPRYLPMWRKLSRFLLIHGWSRGEFAAMGQYLKKVKAMRIPYRPDADPDAAGQGPPDGGANGTAV